MRKIILLVLLFFTVFFGKDAFASDLSIELVWPRKSTAPALTPKPVKDPAKLSGQVTLDISPYPQTVAADRYQVEYFIDDQPVYSTTGISPEQPDALSFKYDLDTRAFENGRHKLIVNFWDSQGQSAIGIREIDIDNPRETNE